MTPCPGCLEVLSESDGPTHRYIGASPACWDVYGRFQAGEPVVAPFRTNALVVDAYAAQHPGVPSPQSIQSVAVHLVTLEAVLTERRDPREGIAVRTRAVEAGRSGHVTYRWLEPPAGSWPATLAEVVAGDTPSARAEIADRWVRGVRDAWLIHHAEVVAEWADRVVGF